MHYHRKLVPLREAFDQIGKLEFNTDWNGSEAAAIAPGKRSFADLHAWKRGRHVLSRMMSFIECERLPVVLHMNGCRVRYGTVPTAPITNLYPCPTNDVDVGFVELGDQDIYHAQADVGDLPKPKSLPKGPRGPKAQYGEFRAACVEYFREYGFAQSNSELRRALGRLGRALKWPRKTRELELINEARDQVRLEPIAIENGGKTVDGAL